MVNMKMCPPTIIDGGEPDGSVEPGGDAYGKMTNTENIKKDPKKQVAGRTGAAVRKAKQERLLAELQAAKESLNATESSEQRMSPYVSNERLHQRKSRSTGHLCS